MYRNVTQWTRIRRRALTGSVSQKQIARETGISRQTIRKMIEFPIPPGYRREKPVNRPTLGPCLGLIDHMVGRSLVAYLEETAHPFRNTQSGSRTRRVSRR
jgi:hypothetical protein